MMIPEEIKQKYLTKMQEETKGEDNETAHSSADCILLEFIKEIGFPELVTAYNEANECCGGFWYA